MRVLLTGASGFSAPFLAKELSGKNNEIFLTAPNPCTVETDDGPLVAKVCDLTDQGATKELVSDINPDAIIHFASLAHVGQSWHDRNLLMKVNVNATSNLCQAVELLNKKVVFIFRSSGQVYGGTDSQQRPQDEKTLPSPLNPYGMSKMAAEYIIKGFASQNFQPYIIRPFNLVGPGQSRAYVCSAFAHRIIQTSDGGSISVGNLESQRDFCDVRDAATAVRLILEKQPQEKLFVLGSGKPTSIQNIFDQLVTLSGKEITPLRDESLMRPSDPVSVVADPQLAKSILGWNAQISLSTTLKEIFSEAKSHY